MNKSKWQRVLAVTLVVALLTSTFVTAAFAAEQAVVLQQRANQPQSVFVVVDYKDLLWHGYPIRRRYETS